MELTPKEIDEIADRIRMSITSLSIAGRYFSDTQGEQAIGFIEKLAGLGYFKTNVPARNIQLKDQSMPLPDPREPGRNAVTFSIECKFPDAVREALR